MQIHSNNLWKSKKLYIDLRIRKYRQTFYQKHSTMKRVKKKKAFKLYTLKIFFSPTYSLVRGYSGYARTGFITYYEHVAGFNLGFSKQGRASTILNRIPPEHSWDSKNPSARHSMYLMLVIVKVARVTAHSTAWTICIKAFM